MEALEGDDNNTPKEYAGLQAIKETRETMAGQRLAEGKLPSPRQLKFGMNEIGIGKQVEEAVKALIDTIEDDENEISVDFKDNVLYLLVF